MAQSHKIPSEAKSPASALQQALVGRQPILDREGNVRGYELLFRPSAEAAARPFDGNCATATVLVNAMTEFGFDHLVGRHSAYINFTKELLEDGSAALLPKDRVVIEILEDIIVSEDLVENVTELVALGYKIALDDFVYQPQWEPLLALASIVKIDVLALNAAEIAEQVDRLRQYSVTLLAEKVETQKEHAALMALGFDLFQGYYYAKPNIVSQDKIPENHVSAVHLLAKLHDDTATQAEIVALISEDVTLSYRLLRYFNSAFFSLPKKVDSINRALIYFGIDMLRKWVGLLVLSGVSAKPKVLMENALVRARMCEGLAQLRPVSDTEKYFTTGLFSILEILLDTPIAKITESLPLSSEIVDALVSGEGDLGAALRCSCAYEEGRWDDVQYADLSREDIGKVYLSSIEWSFEAGSTL